MKRNLLSLWAKRSIFAVALAGTAGLTLPSCEKPEPYREPYEKELFFNESHYDSIRPEILKHFANDKACTHIYLYVMDDNNYTSSSPSNVRNYLQERIDISSKISGRGDFWFLPGRISQEDSLWFVQNGWTINKLYWDHHQR